LFRWWGTKGVSTVKETARFDVLIKLRSVKKSFNPDRQVLRSVSFDVRRGEFLYVTGPSGAGKSTLLKLLYRAELPDGGKVMFCGRDLARLSRKSIPFLRRNIGVVFQDFRLLADRSAHDNVALALEVLGMGGRDIRRRVGYVLERVGLRQHAHELVGHLSGGEQQRVAVARAVVAEPAVVLADEPTGNLDGARAAEVLSLLDGVNRRGTAVILATHDHMLMAARPRRTIALAEGRALVYPEESSDKALELSQLWALREREKDGAARSGRAALRPPGPDETSRASEPSAQWKNDKSADATN
jgi:cell division transport system ATP-binding protein